MNTACIDINNRYYLAPSNVPETLRGFDVIDRALEYQFRPAVVFSNGTEKECREWVERNCEEPVEHTPGPWHVADDPLFPGQLHCIWGDMTHDLTSNFGTLVAKTCFAPSSRPNAAGIATAPKLLALLEQYHEAMPTKESGKLIAEARGWTIQE